MSPFILSNIPNSITESTKLTKLEKLEYLIAFYNEFSYTKLDRDKIIKDFMEDNNTKEK